VSNPLSFLQIIRIYARFSGELPSRRLRILVVDDEEPIRRYVDRVMREAGHETVLASDGLEAIEVARTLQPLDLLLTDLVMPQMSGDELARRLRQTQPGLKVLYLTGFSDSLFKERVTLWEDEAYLDKPCSVESLLRAVSLLTSGQLNAAPVEPKAKPKSAPAV